MIIATVVFGDPIYHRLADVLEYSVALNCPSAEFTRLNVEPHTHIKGIPDHCPANHHKKKHWADIVHNNAGKEIVLLDCDTIVLRDLTHVFSESFDLAYTVRDHHARINAGVMFLRATRATLRFFDKWLYMQELFVSDEQRPHLHARLRKYAGLDQAALTQALKAVDWPFKTRELPCEQYNSVDQTWRSLDEETCILHVKGLLRRYALLSDDKPTKHPAIERAIQTVRRYETLTSSHIGA